MRVSDEELNGMIERGEAFAAKYNPTRSLPHHEACLDLRDARAALRAWKRWQEKCMDECDGGVAWDEAMQLTAKALEVRDE